jgi:hypothetical protein
VVKVILGFCAAFCNKVFSFVSEAFLNLVTIELGPSPYLSPAPPGTKLTPSAFGSITPVASISTSLTPLLISLFPSAVTNSTITFSGEKIAAAAKNSKGAIASSKSNPSNKTNCKLLMKKPPIT